MLFIWGVGIALVLLVVFLILSSFSPPPIRGMVEGRVIKAETKITGGWFTVCLILKIETIDGRVIYGYIEGGEEKDFMDKKIITSFGWRYKSDDKRKYHTLKKIQVLT